MITTNSPKMDDHFVIPKIPVIHVPQFQDPNQPKLPIQKPETSRHQQSNQKPEHDPRRFLPKAPKMCSTCSISLLEYLIPLQEYLTEVIQMTVKHCGVNHMKPEELKSHPNVLHLLNPDSGLVMSRRAQKGNLQLTPESSTDESEGEVHPNEKTYSSYSGSSYTSADEGDYALDLPEENQSTDPKLTSHDRHVKDSSSKVDRDQHFTEHRDKTRDETSQASNSETRRIRVPKVEHQGHVLTSGKNFYQDEHHPQHNSPQKDDGPHEVDTTRRSSGLRAQSPYRNTKQGGDSSVKDTLSKVDRDQNFTEHRGKTRHETSQASNSEPMPRKSRSRTRRIRVHKGQNHGHVLTSGKNYDQDEHHPQHHSPQKADGPHKVDTTRSSSEPRTQSPHRNTKQGGDSSGHEHCHEKNVPRQEYHEPIVAHHDHEVRHEEPSQSHQFSETKVLPEEFPEISVEALEESLVEYSQEEPYAYVTLVYNNLSAVNAIVLANSVILTTQKRIVIFGKMYRIPFVVLLEGNIDPLLKKALAMVFDQVISERQDFRLSLLKDSSVGVQNMKLQLWRSLDRFKKCLFIESSCLVLGDVSGVFTEFSELSACVDWIFPDCFDCSVFVFEPLEETYDALVLSAIKLQQEAEGTEDRDEVDESTILNQFFGPKWNKISFIYNFVQNSAVYTQQPAFMKFGGSIKIVNFGYTPLASNVFSPNNFNTATQPWHVTFDLATSTLDGAEVSTSMPVNRYVKFYISLFVKRLWPLIQRSVTPLLMARVGRREWSIHELVRLLSSLSGDEEMMFSPISFRRKPQLQYEEEKKSPDAAPESVLEARKEQTVMSNDETEEISNETKEEGKSCDETSEGNEEAAEEEGAAAEPLIEGETVKGLEELS